MIPAGMALPGFCRIIVLIRHQISLLNEEGIRAR
jgi:hypothetical protein